MMEGLFHPAVATWFARELGAPTVAQTRAWAAIAAGEHTLVAAPTGSGKTLAAFLAALDALVREGLRGELPQAVCIVYLSPLKALSNDIQINLERPLSGICAELTARGEPPVTLRTAVRTGDTPRAARALMGRQPPHILVTTPESLYLLLTSASGRAMLSTTRMVIVDEIHALAGNKRGGHLSLSLERLAALTPVPPQRVGLSATQKPLATIARFLVGPSAPCTIIDEGHLRARELVIELPPAPLEAVLAGESAADIHDRMAALIRAHRTTLVFVNTRRLAERVARALTERLGENAVTSHHGSMSRDRRLLAEQRLKGGQLQALVATASLELGIDIGAVDLVCQLGSTRSLAMFLQRVGRSGHAVGALAKGRLFPQTRDELVECAALLDMTRRGELDSIEVVGPALDVLAQQLVAEVACRDASLDELYALVCRAYPYRDLPRATFNNVITMLAEGYSFAPGRRSAYLHLDAVNGLVRARRGARLTALTCGGAIPDTADYDVIAEPMGHVVGTVNEDFAIDSLPGSIFQLGNTAWRILKVEAAAMRVVDAAGQPPNIPFWFGEAPARSVEMSQAVSRLREEFIARVDAATGDARVAVESWLALEVGAGPVAARQLYDYLLGGCRALAAMPTNRRLVLERFFDESGGMQLVIHSPLGARVNRAWGLALRKRFCRQFNFELQAAAVEDAIVISLGAVHSFPLEEVWRYLKAETVREVLIQALLDAPMFGIRWRWVACCALAIQRFRQGKKTPPRLLRMQAEDLVSLVFPEQLACAENLQGRREIPDHPLVQQAIFDCLNEVMDIAGLEALLGQIEAGAIELVCRDQVEPSPFAQAVLNANPYAFLDDAPLEERRTQAVQSRRWLDPDTARSLGALDSAAIARVRSEVWPAPESLEESHDALLVAGVLSAAELAGENVGRSAVLAWLAALSLAGRASCIELPGGTQLRWVATERFAEARAVWPALQLRQGRGEFVGLGLRAVTGRDDALRELVRGRLAIGGPLTAGMLGEYLGLAVGDIDPALYRLEQEGSILRGTFSAAAQGTEWCDRRLLARIHRYTLNRLRAEIEPVPAAAYLRFVLGWQYLTPGTRVEGLEATRAVIETLAGFEAPAAAWESALLPARISDYSPDYLDALMASGRSTWARLSAKMDLGARSAGPLKSTPLALLPRLQLPDWLAFATPSSSPPSVAAQRVVEYLRSGGAAFFEDITADNGLLRTQTENILGELASLGLVTADSFAGLRALLLPSALRRPLHGARRGRAPTALEAVGRWDLVRRRTPDPLLEIEAAPARLERIALVLVKRYGIVFRRLLERESLLPPWRDLLPALRRLEARGELRGGRFVAGFSGEQFAAPTAVEALRAARERGSAKQFVGLHAADPANLVGIVLPGPKIPATLNNRLVLLDGELVAVQLGDEISFLRPLSSDEQIRARTALTGARQPKPGRAWRRAR
ncbi:MAG: DEAD/DEAH box helicase [Gammaproteobacteria bacterium]|nr:DEAD/DEAH box helicase [Gammaproteobacteria bacterium]